MKKSLGRKICWIGSLLIISFVIMNIILTYFFMAPFSSLFYHEQMEEFGEEIKQVKLENEEDLKNQLDLIDENNNVKVTVIDGEKNILYTTKAFLKKEGVYWTSSMELFDSNRRKIDKGENVFLTRKKQQKNNKNTIQVIMIQMISPDRYIVMSRSYQSLQNAMYSALIFEAVIGIVLVFLGWIVTYRLSRYMVVPIQKMTVAAERISNLDFDIKVEVNTMDEIGQLGTSINKMSEQLEMNMTQMQEDIENRKRLVRNLSHEIKSPMAVIMGYTDRMKAVMKKNPDKALEYCEIISNESTRVDVMVKEMLELSKMDQRTDELNKEVIQIKDFFEDIKKRFQEENCEKSVSYQENYDDTERITADVVLLDRAVYNLIQNAISHGSQEQLSIRVSGERKEAYYEIKVFNTGNPIDETEISSLWEPFSKVDKVRTRGKQGYGVGLAIVREIVEAHEGYYSVCNAENGVEFTIAIKG